MTVRSLLMVVMITLASAVALHAADKPDDRDALAGLTSAKVIFDVRVPDSEKLVFNLNLFRETFEGIASQGVKPEMIISFRGPGVKLLTASVIDKEALDLIRELKRKGVRFEVCAVALRIFKADPAGIIPEARLVANVLNSFIGYQNKGYAMIAIN